MEYNRYSKEKAPKVFIVIENETKTNMKASTNFLKLKKKFYFSFLIDAISHEYVLPQLKTK